MSKPTYFVSYTRADQAWAEWIAWQLEAAGYTVTVQVWDSRPGNDFVAWMDRSIRAAERILVVLTPAYDQATSFTVPELSAAIGRDPTGELGVLLPVRVVDFTPDGLLRTRTWVDLVGKDHQAAREALLAGVSQERPKPDREPPFPGEQPPEPVFPGKAPPTSTGQARRRAPLNALYVQALDELRLEHFAAAIELLDNLLTLDPHYQNAAALQDAARRGRQLADAYTSAKEAEDAGDWAAAAQGYDEILAIAPTYRDAAERRQANHDRDRAAQQRAAVAPTQPTATPPPRPDSKPTPLSEAPTTTLANPAPLQERAWQAAEEETRTEAGRQESASKQKSRGPADPSQERARTQTQRKPEQRLEPVASMAGEAVDRRLDEEEEVQPRPSRVRSPSGALHRKAPSRKRLIVWIPAAVAVAVILYSALYQYRSNMHRLYRVVATIKVGDYPNGIAVNTRGVWVTNSSDNTVSRIDPARNRVVATIKVGEIPGAVAADTRGVWVAHSSDNTVSRIDPARNRVVATIKVGSPSGIAVNTRGVWVTQGVDDIVSRIDPARNRVVATIKVGVSPQGVAADTRGVWVANGEDDTVSRIDPARNRVVATIKVGDHPNGMAIGTGAVWVASGGSRGGTVSRIDPVSNRVVATIKLGADDGLAIAVERHDVWLTKSNGYVSRIDPASNRVLATDIQVGSYPPAIAVNTDDVWVANSRDDAVSRIGPVKNRID